jgi:thymidylate synthase (FAD)
MAHCIVPEAEKILDEEFPVLDKGFVRLVDYLGGDERIAQAARVSYGEGTKTYRESKGLIDYLLRNEHTSPFEQVNFTFHLKMPIFIARQWIRHRTAKINEISGRYSVMKNEFYLPSGENIAEQSESNKQGRKDEPVSPELQTSIIEALKKDQQTLYATYEEFLENGLARELARVNLPLSLYTEFYWQMDLHNLFHFLRLRMHPHAQAEIRFYAERIFEIIKVVCPLACGSFVNHLVEGVRFSGAELDELRRIVEGREVTLTGRALQRFRNKLETGTE